MMKSRKAICGVLLVFVLGILCGLFASRLLHNRLESVTGGRAQTREEQIVSRLDKRLDLTDEQEEQVRGIVHQTHEEIQALRDQLRPQTEALIEKAQARISGLLTPAQRKEYERMIAERKERIKKRPPHGSE
jgi:Spy/CpxP family protein refolding chaperone